MVEWINILSTLYFVATLILSYEYQQPALILFFASTVLDIIVNKRYTTKWENSRWVFVLMIILYSCSWVWHIFEDCNSNLFFHSTDIKLPFLAFGIIGLFGKINPKIKWSYVAVTMLVSSIVVLIAMIVNNIEYIQENITSINEFRENIARFRGNTIHTTHIEFNIFLNCTIVACFVNIIDNQRKWCKVLFGIGAIVIYISLFCSEGRTGFLTSNILFALFFLLGLYKYKPKLIIPLVAVFVVLITALAMQHNRFKPELLNKEPRLSVWAEAIDLIKEKPIMGYGTCNGRYQFVERCLNNDVLKTNFWPGWFAKVPDYKVHRFHCHNIFIESTLEFGIIGLLIVVGLFVLPIILTKGKIRRDLFLFVTIFVIQGTFESFTSHYQIMLFCWIVYYLTTHFTNKRNSLF